ncbi:hypothetical protein FA13DRAFT_1681824 [Coprinellus micaceus]|uniref:Mitochondrial intermembrane space import and assembly protein 40 n=1 Tax=Coprinellus micaceus TaxID=71717 RepID=A0A4Y7TW53_COPMI|nr:hypothetical protein FA13DRAFT_1681824 [Coprinellus micaceus]
MYARFARQALRRGLHTASSSAKATPRFSNAAKFAVGASSAATALLTWNLMSEKNRVYLDSPSKSSTAPHTAPKPTKKPTEPAPVESTPSQPEASSSTETPTDTPAPAPGASEGEVKGEAPQPQGAYNPETGEINWDCPCLGGMAHGPCGEQFKEAFSCFVFSEDEPKGINCVGAFKNMQDCFREHPEVYADEIMDDDEPEPAPASAPAAGDATEEFLKDPAQEIPAVAETHSEHRTETEAPSKPKTSSSQ